MTRTVTEPATELPAAERYLATLSEKLGRLPEQSSSIAAAATAIADTIAADGLVHVFGTGHSHLIAAELFYRAGGLGAINPILLEGLLLHAGAELSTALERTAGLGEVVFGRLGATSADTLIVISNSGSNVIACELAVIARRHGMTVIALTSLAHATSATSRATAGPRIDQLADIVLDNLGEPGDAAISIAGLDYPMAPTSTVLGAAIVNAVAVTAAQRLVDRGITPKVFTSSNMAGGDEENRSILDSYRQRVRSL